MSNNVVTILPQKGYYRSQIAVNVKNYFDEKGYDFEGKTVMLKPSFVMPSGDIKITLATDTHNLLVAGVAKALELKGAKKILIAEHRTIGPARYAFYSVGIKKAVKGIKNVKMCYLDEKKRVKTTIDNPFIENYEVKYPKMLLDGSIDYLISLPKLKMNIYTQVTLSIKNNFGLISKKERLKYHSIDTLDAHLASLTLIKKPDLIITDAIIAGEGQGPHLTKPVNTGMMICGENPLAVDTVCCHLIGVDPYSIGHLKLLKERGVGPLDLEEIEIENREYFEANKKEFEKPDDRLDMTPLMKVFQGPKHCVAGCLGMLRGSLDSYANEKGWYSLGRLNIIIGDAEVPEEELAKLDKKRTIVYGDCAKKYKKYGTFFKGCPPDYVKGLLKMSFFSPLGINPNFKLSRVSPMKYLTAWGVHILQKIFRF
ncbi:MAG: DUF362 domain-containing protein [Promethearchaeota archaeon]